MTATTRGTDPTDPPECRSAEWSTEFGLLLEDQSAAGGYKERVNSVRWPIQMSVNRMKHNRVGCCARSPLQAGTITWIEYNSSAYSNLWFNMVRGKFLVRLLSSLLFKKNEKTECCGFMMTAGSGLKNLQRSDTKCWGQSRQCGSKSNTLYDEEPAYETHFI